MSTDTMREKFEQWWSEGNSIREAAAFLDRGGNGYISASLHNQWLAYQQGQRDLIEAMGEPVAYHGKSEIHEGITSDQRIVQLWGGFNHIVVNPLYRLPEDTPK